MPEQASEQLKKEAELELFRVEELPETSEGAKVAALNILTTGTRPEESELIGAALAEIYKGQRSVDLFVGKDEEALVKAVFEWLRSHGTNIIVGYRPQFDVKYLIVKGLAYGQEWPHMLRIELEDLSERLSYYPGVGKPSAGKRPDLSSQSKYILNAPELYPAKKVLSAWKEGKLEPILEQLAGQVGRIASLYALTEKLGKPEPKTLRVGARERVKGTEAEDQRKAKPVQEKTISGPAEVQKYKCPYCLSEFNVPTGKTMELCPVCGEPLKMVS